MLERIITSKAKRGVLALFFTNPKSSFYVREVCRKARIQPNEASAELEKLCAAGILQSERRGNLLFYSANPSCSIYNELKAIVLKTAGVGDALREAIGKSAGVKFAFIYGSYARGEERKESDIDVMIIGRASPEEISGSLLACEKMIGREINYSIYPEEEISAKRRKGYIEGVLKGKKVMLAGEEDELERFAFGRKSKAG